MRRSTLFPENENSDQSISEDDDLNEDLLEDHVSLGIPADKKGGVQILSQLDMLRDTNEVIHERNETCRNQSNCVEDDEEILSDNEVGGNCMQLSACFTSEADRYQKTTTSSFGGNRKDGVCTWLAANADADALVNVNNNAESGLFHPASAKTKWSRKGGQGKAKRKFSIRTQKHYDNVFEDSSHVYEGHRSIKGKEMDEMKYLMPVKLPVSHTHATTSMAELLLRVQDEHDLQEGSTMKYNKRKNTSGQLVKTNILSTGRSDVKDDPDCLNSNSSQENKYSRTKTTSEQLAVKTNILSTGQSDREEDSDSLNSDSSQENEEIHQIQEYKQKTIADQFHEALGATSTNEEGHIYAVPRHTGFGLFGKLQRVIQREKETDSYFLNKLRKEDEVGCLDVKILSKTLEGKLAVCSCSSIENDESSTSTDNCLNIINRKNFKIIFSSRICSGVELDVGTLVRIHPPWKEVNVKGKDEITILSTYFSQI